MDADLALILGLVIAALSLIAALKASAESRNPRPWAAAALVAAALIIYALASRPGGYAMDEIPTVFLDTVARVMR